MKLEDQVTNLELSKRLKELGVKQESLYRWQKIDEFEWEPTALKKSWFEEHFPEKIIYSAFTASELLEMLPGMFKIGEKCYFITMDCDKHIYYEDMPKTNEIHVSEDNDNLVDSMAKMLIHLIQNKIIEV